VEMGPVEQHTSVRIRPTLELSGLEGTDLVAYGCAGHHGKECARFLFENLLSSDRWVGRFCESTALGGGARDPTAVYWLGDLCLVICGGLAHLLTPLVSREGTVLRLDPVRGHSVILEQKLVAIWDFRRVVVVSATGVSESIAMDEGEVASVSVSGREGDEMVLQIQLCSLIDDARISISRRVSAV
jgi:hypothetical protein